MNQSEHLIVIKYVMANPKSSLKDIALATGFGALNLHRFLTDYELKKPRKIFSWIDSPMRKIDKNLKPIGGHQYLFSVRPEFSLEMFLEPKQKARKVVISKPVEQKVFVRDPITAALFGSTA